MAGESTPTETPGDGPPINLMANALSIMRQAQESTSLSLMDLAAAFRIAAAACDEANTVHERANMAQKLRNWKLR